jgi:hypothetical protein
MERSLIRKIFMERVMTVAKPAGHANMAGLMTFGYACSIPDTNAALSAAFVEYNNEDYFSYGN